MNTTTTHDRHREVEMWAGPPGECGVACSCGVSYDGFDSVGEASELLEQQHTTTTRGRHREPATRPAWLLPALGALAAVVLLVVLGACETDDRTPAQREADEQAAAEQAAYDEMTDLQKVADDCDAIGITAADGGRTLLIDHKGEDDSTGASIDDVVCAMAKLDVPSSLLTRIDTTRALDGTQSGEWDGYTAVWSYHPDSGLNIIIEED